MAITLEERHNEPIILELFIHRQGLPYAQSSKCEVRNSTSKTIDPLKTLPGQSSKKSIEKHAFVFSLNVRLFHVVKNFLKKKRISR